LQFSFKDCLNRGVKQTIGPLMCDISQIHQLREIIRHDQRTVMIEARKPGAGVIKRKLLFQINQGLLYFV